MNHIMYNVSKDILAAKQKGISGFELLLYNYVKQFESGVDTQQIKEFLKKSKFTSDVIFKALADLLVRDLIYKEGNTWKVM
jgi:hypothetical protein